MRRVFIDAGVLIEAARGNQQVSSLALMVLNQPDFEYASSPFIKLEVLPKAIYQRQTAETEFYEAFFASVSHWASELDTILREGDRISRTYGLAAMDALHIAAALTINAEEFITTEKLSKPLHRVTEISIISLAT